MPKWTLEKLLTGRGLRHLTARPKLVLCIPIVALSYLALPAGWHGTTRLLVAWNIGTWPYIALTVRAMARANEASIRRQALMGDESRFVVLTFCIVAALASLAATVAQLGSVKEAQDLLRTGHLILAFGTIVSAFVFIHLVFTQHYAHEFFILRASEESLPEEARGGLRFPYTAKPTFADFAYYAFVIGCACQTADVETTSAPMRTVTVIHGVLSFFFNTAVLALTINIASGLV
jgi:uncharacterized membrane protein